MLKKLAYWVGVCAVGLGLSGTAAALTVNNLANAPDSWAAAMAATPNTLNAPGTWTKAPATVAGNWTGVYRSVFDNQGVPGTPDNSAYFGLQYWAVGPVSATYVNNPAIMTFATDQNSLSFLWGSVDSYNGLEFWLNGAKVGTVTNASFAGELGGLGASYVRITGVTFDEIRFSSSTNAFEFSNLTSTPVPIPAAAWLLGSGLLGLFGIARRR